MPEGNDKELFSEAVRQCRPAMYALAYGILQNQEDAADVMQEAILRAYSQFGRLRDRGKFRPWILSITHNAAVDHVRAHRSTAVLELQPETAAPEPAIDMDTRLSVWEAVQALKLPYRTVILLFYYESCSVTQIASITHTSPGAVRQQLARGRKLLARLLPKEDFTP